VNNFELLAWPDTETVTGRSVPVPVGVRQRAFVIPVRLEGCAIGYHVNAGVEKRIHRQVSLFGNNRALFGFKSIAQIHGHASGAIGFNNGSAHAFHS
jgi:hypothetical protein